MKAHTFCYSCRRVFERNNFTMGRAYYCPDCQATDWPEKDFHLDGMILNNEELEFFANMLEKLPKRTDGKINKAWRRQQ